MGVTSRTNGHCKLLISQEDVTYAVEGKDGGNNLGWKAAECWLRNMTEK
jgi:hypothetical protein